MEELIAGYVGQKDVWPSVVVIVPDGYAHPIARPSDSGTLGHIGERAVVIISIQTVPVPRRFFLQRRYGSAVYQIDVEPPVSVIVEQRDSGNHGFYLIFVRSRRVLSCEAQARFSSNVFELDWPRTTRCLCRGVRSNRRSPHDRGDQSDGKDQGEETH